LNGVESDTTDAAWSMPVCVSDQFFTSIARAAGVGIAGVR
jgi:hypothetical protein